MLRVHKDGKNAPPTRVVGSRQPEGRHVAVVAPSPHGAPGTLHAERAQPFQLVAVTPGMTPALEL